MITIPHARQKRFPDSSVLLGANVSVVFNLHLAHEPLSVSQSATKLLWPKGQHLPNPRGKFASFDSNVLPNKLLEAFDRS